MLQDRELLPLTAHGLFAADLERTTLTSAMTDGGPLGDGFLVNGAA